jgi:hypothetical protein
LTSHERTTSVIIITISTTVAADGTAVHPTEVQWAVDGTLGTAAHLVTRCKVETVHPTEVISSAGNADQVDRLGPIDGEIAYAG